MRFGQHFPRSALAAGIVSALLTSPGLVSAQTKLSVGMPTNPPNVVHTPMYIAKDLGFYKAEGVDVELLSFEGGVYSFRAMVSGDVDLAASSAPFAIVARGNGAKTRFVFSTTPRLESSMVVQSNIKTLKDLKGRRVGIQEPGGFAFVLSMMVLNAAGLKKDDVELVSILSEDVPPLVAGQIDTAILHVEQEIVALGRKPSLHVLARLGEIVPKQMYLAYAAREDTIAKKRKALLTLVKGNIQAARLIYTDRKKALPIIVQHTGLDEGVANKTLDILIKNCAWDVNAGLPREMVEFTTTRMVKIGNLDAAKAPKYEDVVDLSLAEQALKELGPYTGSVCSTK